MKRCAAALVAVALLAPASARARTVTGAQLRALAARAAHDPAALARLRAVDRVDGRSMDVAGALAGAGPAQLRARLTLLAAPGTAPAARGASAQARAILAERRFHGTRVPGPFRGLLDRLGRRLRSLGAVVRFLDRLLPGGRSVVWLVLAGSVTVAAGLIARATRAARRRQVGALTRGAASAAKFGNSTNQFARPRIRTGSSYGLLTKPSPIVSNARADAVGSCRIT